MNDQLSYVWLYFLLQISCWFYYHSTSHNRASQLINWNNFILDILTNYIEASLGKASYSFLTNLAKGNSGISR